MERWRGTGGGGYINWDRSGQEHTWWISMYRWRCTWERGIHYLGKVRLGAYILDIHVQVICLNVDMFNPSICLIPIRFKADRFKSAIGLNADMFNNR
jgi:hypothetical protein